MTLRDLSLDLNPKLERREPGSYIPLASTLRRVWNMTEAHTRRMCVGSFHVRGPLHVAFVRMSIEALSNRHEALRMRFVPFSESAVLHVATTCEGHFSFIDLTACEGDATAAAKRLAEEFLSEEISLQAHTMFETRLYKIASETHLLVIGLPHILTDGHSNVLLVREFWLIYHHFHFGWPLDLPYIPLQFGDYLCWQHATEDAWIATHAQYWKERFESLAPVEVPVDKPAGTGAIASEMLHFTLGRSVSERLYELSRSEQTDIQILLFAALSIVMSHWCGRTDFAAYFVLHGRHGRPELEHMVGFLANLLPLRIRVLPEDRLATVVSRMQAEFQSSWSHYDFGRAADFLPKNLSDIGLNWSNRMQKAKDRQFDGSPIVVQRFALDVGWRARFITFFYRTHSGIGVTIDYRPDLLERSTVEGFVRRIRLAAEALAGRSTRSVGDILASDLE